MDTLLRRHAWLINLLAVGLCAVLLGRAASSLVHLRLLGAGLPALRAGPRPLARPAPLAKEIEPILARNIFCSTCPPILVGPAVDQQAADLQLRPTALPLQMLALNHIVQPSDGDGYALAVLRDTETRAVGAFATGDVVKGAVITGFDQVRLYLDNRGAREYLDLLEVPPPVAALAAPAASAEGGAAPGGDALTRELQDGISKTGPTSYEVRRSALEAVLGDMGLLARSARVVPEMKEGKAAGFRLLGIRPGGPFALIGLANGDLLVAINGLELTSPEQAFTAFAKLKSASHLSVGIERAGRRVSLEYAIR